MANSIKNKIMVRVYAIFMLRKIKDPATLSWLGFFVSLWMMFVMVSLGDVFTNMPSIAEIGSLFSFYTSAVFDTELPVKLTLLGALVLGFINLSLAIRAFYNRSLNRESHIS